MAEAVYLFGVMLIILDLKYDATARERMIVSYFRYRLNKIVYIQDNLYLFCRILVVNVMHWIVILMKSENY
jgi:hypothetical protein